MDDQNIKQETRSQSLPPLINPETPTLHRARKQVLHREVQLIHGSSEIDYELDELVAVCLVRDGREYVKSFVEHHLSIGIKHLVFLDNGSSDGTIDFLQQYENVTVLRTNLPFKKYQLAMKQYLMERFGKHRWVLCIDIDELFSYPYSETLSLKSFLHYLNDGKYTAVVGQMLDMFPDEPLSDTKADVEEVPLKSHARFYDLSNVNVRSYWDYPVICSSGNVLADDQVEMFKDGVQDMLFKNSFTPLTKHPLVFMDGKTKPMNRSVHSVGDAYIADVTCLLLHYKMLNSLYEHVRRAVQQENYMRNSRKHKKRLQVLEQNPELHIMGETSKELKSTDELVARGFLVISEEYMKLVEDQGRKSGQALTDGPWELVKSLLTMQSEIHKRNTKVGELSKEIDELKKIRHNFASRGQRLNQLERENRELRSRARRVSELRERNQILETRIDNLQRRVQEIHSSRVWMSLNRLNQVKNKILHVK